MVREEGAVTALRFDSMSQGNFEHLNVLARSWRQGNFQERTQQSGMKRVVMRLKDAGSKSTEVSFPHVPGEEFSRMWEQREVDEAIGATLGARGIMLLINGDRIQLPAWIVERNAVAQGAGLAPGGDEAVKWSADLAPTQVQVVELLQLLMSDELSVGPRRLAILLSAWDRAEGERLTPEELLSAKLPLLNQHLHNGRDPWTWRLWGLSAQGGVYEDPTRGSILRRRTGCANSPAVRSDQVGGGDGRDHRHHRPNRLAGRLITKVVVHQTLHGYSAGHRLIAGSVTLSSAEARMMQVMSALSGPGVKPPASGYLTGYLLDGSGRYVLARTWAASEMSRPGCV